MTKKEQRVWELILADRSATAAQIAERADVKLTFVEELMAKIGTPEEVWRGTEPSGALAEQVGGSHYRDMSVQPWQAMEAWLTPEEYRGYHKGVAIAYLARERQKGGTEDIKKAIHHLQRLVEWEGEDQ